MMIRHSIELLEQLHELETQLRKWEQLAQIQGLEIESEMLLRLAMLKHLKVKKRQKPLTETKDVS